MQNYRKKAFFITLLFSLNFIFIKTALSDVTHAISMRGDPKYAATYSNFDYVNPNAPQGGEAKYGASGSFDSLNRFSVKGRVPGSLKWTNFIFEPLLVRSYDEPFSLYGHIAQKIDMAADRTSITFFIHPKARFSDGKALTVNDVEFSFNKLKEQGLPGHRKHYATVTTYNVDQTQNSITFNFEPDGNPEAPLLMGNLPILPKHIYEDKDLNASSLDIPVGSGPYVIDEMTPGDFITFKKNPDYWAQNMPSVRGFYNIGTIRYDYYRDATAVSEAFRAGNIAFRRESDPEKWKNALDFPGGKNRLVKKSEFEMKLPKPYKAIVLNTRKAPFDNRNVRKAMAILFDSESINELFYASEFSRTEAIFYGSILSPIGKKASEAEEKLLLNPLEDKIMEGDFALFDKNIKFRTRIRAALKLLKEEGWQVKDGALTHQNSGQPFAVEFLVRSAETERIALAYQSMLKRAGITLNITQSDSAQYTKRKQNFDYDIILNTWYFSLSPGAEQGLYWTTTAADTPGTRNYMGLKDPQIDNIVKYIENAASYDDLTTGVQALSRSIANSYATIPLFHVPKQWVAHWDYLHMHPTPSWYGSIAETWWIE